MTKRPLIAWMLATGLVSTLAAQQAKPSAPAGTRVPTATRLVVTFHELESQLTAAVQKNDENTLDRLLASDFEVWTPEPPGDPIPRGEWLQKNKSAESSQASRIRQMTAIGFGDHAVASFVLLQGTGKQWTANFVVDVWARVGTEWKLVERYTSSVPATHYATQPKPTGKD